MSNEDYMKAQRAHEEAVIVALRTIRVTVERSGYQAGRVCLKAVDGEGKAKLIVENLLPGDACRERNQLVERLVSSGQYDEVTGELIQPMNNQTSNKAQQ